LKIQYILFLFEYLLFCVVIKNFNELDKLLSLFEGNEVFTSGLSYESNLKRFDKFLYHTYNKPLIIETKNEKLKKLLYLNIILLLEILK
jgi:CRISPR/Cas system CSM-associated protein Csm4 (group 5 of RAMP superfamily)